MDALAAVLAAAGVRGTIAATVNAAEPWGLTLDAIPAAAFHAIAEGAAWLRVHGSGDNDSGDSSGIWLAPGDVILLPGGAAHTLASSPGARTQPWARLAAAQALAPGGEISVGTGPAQARILCASYQQDPAVTLPLLTLLPDVLHLPASRAGPGLDTTLRLLAHELAQPQPGTAAVLNWLVDILLVQVLRIWLATSASQAGAASWLRALTDPVAGPALAMLHAQPGRPWTVGSLAAGTGVSSATLARRFTATVGQPPAAYLARWRMDLAAQRLRDTDETIGAIARSLGYTSEYAFNRAFTRHRRTPPGRYRSQARPVREMIPGPVPERALAAAEPAAVSRLAGGDPLAAGGTGNGDRAD
jgi:AraC-like DNA-binding protein